MKGVVASVMHTGTWFTFEVIKRLTGDVVLPWRHTFRPRNPQDCDWLHVHVNDEPWSDERFIHSMLLEAFVERARYPTVIPLRDPVLALITRHHRREEEKVPALADLCGLVEGFERIADWYFGGLRRVFWFPVDLHKSATERSALLKDLGDFMYAHRCIDLSYRRRAPGIRHQLADEWPIRNETVADSTLKERYQAGDVAAIDDVLPAEMEKLRASRLVCSMFADLGYSLPWVRS